MPEEMTNKVIGWVTILFAAMIGRLMFHAYQVQRGHRRFWTWTLLLDLIIACGMGVIAHGLCSYFGISGAPESGLIAIAGYLGPHGIDVIFTKRFGTSTSKQEMDK